MKGVLILKNKDMIRDLRPISFSDVDVTGGFWKQKQDLIRDVTIFAVRDRFRDTGRFQAFHFSWHEGSDEPKPHFFWDSDIAKWIESAAFLLQKQPDAALEETVEQVIDCMEQHRDADGYFNIYHTVVEPNNRFGDRDHHELYCLGHLIEAGVAYYNATGRDRLLNILDRYIDLVIRVFCVERSANFTTPGHEEIELALIKLYRLRKEQKYLDLALFFLNERGVRPEQGMAWCRRQYMQSHLPVREQKTAEGHAVRACYLYSAMADAAKETGDEALLSACKAIFDDIVLRKMYITGGIGSSNRGEAFTIPFDLPNDTAYAETCASIALSMFADRMKELDLDAKYADIVEREWYNGALAGLSLDGKRFFYENPLEINLADRTRHTSVRDSDRLPITQRVEVFDCSCCPPNLTRYIASVGSSVYSAAESAVFVHQFFANTAAVAGAQITMETNYPADGDVHLSVTGAKGKTLFVRIPGWCKRCTCSAPYRVQNGYAVFEIASDSFALDLTFDMQPVFLAANPAVRADVGKAALQYGPLVYCLESVDNGPDLFDLVVSTSGGADVQFREDLGANVITLPARRSDKAAFSALYAPCGTEKKVAAQATFIPYFAFANRGESDMAVWFRYDK